MAEWAGIRMGSDQSADRPEVGSTIDLRSEPAVLDGLSRYFADIEKLDAAEDIRIRILAAVDQVIDTRQAQVDMQVRAYESDIKVREMRANSDLEIDLVYAKAYRDRLAAASRLEGRRLLAAFVAGVVLGGLTLLMGFLLLMTDRTEAGALFAGGGSLGVLLTVMRGLAFGSTAQGKVWPTQLRRSKPEAE